MKKVVYIDCDGTLQNDQGQISQRTKGTIEKFTKAGNHLILCTGRPRYHVEKIWEEIECDKFFISSNGAEIYNNKEGKPLRIIHIETEDVIKLYTFAKENGIDIYAPSEGIEFVTGQIKDPKQRMFPENTKEVRELVEKNKIKQMLLRARDIEKIEKAKELVQGMENLVILNESTNKEYPGIAVGNSNVSKGNAVKELTAYLGNTIENTIAIGNDYNDLSMFEIAGQSVAMDNSMDYIKEKVDIITLSNNEDGVAAFLEQLL